MMLNGHTAAGMWVHGGRTHGVAWAKPCSGAHMWSLHKQTAAHSTEETAHAERPYSMIAARQERPGIWAFSGHAHNQNRWACFLPQASAPLGSGVSHTATLLLLQPVYADTERGCAYPAWPRPSQRPTTTEHIHAVFSRRQKPPPEDQRVLQNDTVLPSVRLIAPEL